MPQESILNLLVRELLPVAKDGILAAVAAHNAGVRAQVLQRSVTLGEAPPSESGCPYCACVKLLATGHRYLLRASRKPQLAGTYQELTAISIKQVLLILEDGGHGAPRHERLLEQATEMDILLSIPLSPSEMRTGAQRCSDMTELALDLAEWHNSGEAAAQAFQHETAGVGELPITVIEGEGRVVS